MDDGCLIGFYTKINIFYIFYIFYNTEEREMFENTLKQQHTTKNTRNTSRCISGNIVRNKVGKYFKRSPREIYAIISQLYIQRKS